VPLAARFLVHYETYKNFQELLPQFYTVLPNLITLPELATFRPDRQNRLPNEISNLKRFFLDFLVVGSSYSQFIPLNLT
jgi:hypothetical protein